MRRDFFELHMSLDQANDARNLHFSTGVSLVQIALLPPNRTRWTLKSGEMDRINLVINHRSLSALDPSRIFFSLWRFTWESVSFSVMYKWYSEKTKVWEELFDWGVWAGSTSCANLLSILIQLGYRKIDALEVSERFKGLYLLESSLNCLWFETH